MSELTKNISLHVKDSGEFVLRHHLAHQGASDFQLNSCGQLIELMFQPPLGDDLAYVRRFDTTILNDVLKVILEPYLRSWTCSTFKLELKVPYNRRGAHTSRTLDLVIG